MDINQKIAELVDTNRRVYQIGGFTFDGVYKKAYGNGFRIALQGMAGYVSVKPLIEGE